MTRLVQFIGPSGRRVAMVEEPGLRPLSNGIKSIYDLVQRAADANSSISQVVKEHLTNELLVYDPIYEGRSEVRLRAPIDHPDPARVIISGTGLTHLGSAKNRQAMHGASDAELNDSMKIFHWGLEAGKPAPGKIGVAPEWFYKGTGQILRAHNEPLDVPPYAEDGGEEGEIAGIYFIDANGQPRRIGMAIGNEFSDHKFERKNYLNLAGSKLRTCSIGPELVLDPKFDTVPGTVSIERAGQTLWTQPIITGENEMVHSLANIEHHHFKFENHRRPGDIHIHYFGACSLSFGAGIELAEGDQMIISFPNFGRPLRNPLKIIPGENKLFTAKAL